MVDDRVVERSRDGHRFLKLKLLFYWSNLVNWRPDEILMWKVEDRRLGRVGV
jgi:hypothetical protein